MPARTGGQLGEPPFAFFAQTITAEPTAAFDGAAYAAGFVLSVLGLRQHRMTSGWAYVGMLALMTITGAYDCWRAHPASR